MRNILMVSPLVTEFITDNSFYLQTKDVVGLRVRIIYRIVGAGCRCGGGHCPEAEHRCREQWEHHQMWTRRYRPVTWLLNCWGYPQGRASLFWGCDLSSSRIADDVHTKSACCCQMWSEDTGTLRQRYTISDTETQLPNVTFLKGVWAQSRGHFVSISRWAQSRRHLLSISAGLQAFSSIEAFF